MDCYGIKGCETFIGHNEIESSDSPGVMRGLVDLAASLDSVLKEHLKTATVF